MTNLRPAIVILLAALSIPNIAQQAKPLAFDVVSIKPNKSGSLSGGTENRPNGLYAVNMPLGAFLYRGFSPSQIYGVPEWLTSERFDLETKVSGADFDAYQKLSGAERMKMLQAVFKDRLHLKTHQETRELPVYLLVPAGNKNKLQPAQSGDANNRQPPPHGVNEGEGMFWIQGPDPLESKITGQSASMERLARRLSYMHGLDRKVIDQTGLTGQYNFTLDWATSNQSDSAYPSIFTALQEQLGLKLESSKAPIEVLIIDHIERPSEN